MLLWHISGLPSGVGYSPLLSESDTEGGVTFLAFAPSLVRVPGRLPGL
jgi:hypothetical protein